MDNKLTNYILKHSRKKDKELKYDFMPSLLEIIERPAHKAGTIIILGIFTLLIAAVIWACFSKIDVVVSASGAIQPVGNLNTVQSYTNGTVKSINVSEGDYVKKGDVLVKLDTQSLEIDEKQLSHQKNILLTQQEIYSKIKNGDDLSTVIIDDYEEELKSYIQAILDSDVSYNNSLLSIEKQKEMASLNHQIAQLQLDEYKSLNNTNQIKRQELIVNQYVIEIEQAELKIEDTKKQYSVQINSKLSEISSKLDEIQTNLEKYQLSIKYQNIISPVSGYVHSISVNTLGETVASGEDIISIVPDGTPVEMVCYVTNKDIADIELGMEVEIKLEAYPYNKFGTVKGKVEYISPSSFANEQLGSVYLVKVSIIDANEKIDIISGLSGVVEIKTDKRTVMDYFLEPIKKGFGESLKEK
ncbi:MAG: HlyD family efflux transporter periplasmic adaptor subunit [Ruminococcus sp.]|nr:HlyD family efflux transporter periplasmic adaptor subunit [Ruminococcus sp.]